MLSSLITRVWATTLVYVGLAFATWSARHVASPILAYGVLALITFLFGQVVISAISSERQLDSLGKRAPQVRDYSPWGVYFLWKAIRHFMQYKNAGELEREQDVGITIDALQLR